MKKLLLILLCLPFIGFGQLTYVPDDNFEVYLEDNGMGNGIMNDDYVSTTNINTVTGLYISNQNISDLTGIEDFIALEYLSCGDNQITNLDLSNNTNLNNLSCYNNQIINLDVSNSPNLEYLICYNNQLTDLNVSNNSLLHHLYCFGNLLTSLDVSNIPCSNWQEPAFNSLGGWGTVIDNPNLFCIKVDNASCWNSLYTWSIDTTYQYYSNNCSSSTEVQEQNTNKDILKITDLLGRETKQKNQPLLYIYDDGTVEKRITID
tara:strand:+ start:291 stop:1076 length:786 start_codon:yes stop_codon:yes gene_type:complete